MHIPIVCFGIAFPAMILFVHGLYLRTGEAHYKALAKRWSKVALTLFAVGVVTGTILSFEFGLLWPDFMATFGEVFGVAFGLEGVSFFLEAIFIAIYVYGWDRLPRRTHFLTGIPVVIAGFFGSFCVIAVNGWMNHPTGFSIADGRVVDPEPWTALLNSNMWHELIHMYVAGYIVAGFIVAGVYAAGWLRGKRYAYHRTGLVVALSFAALAAPVQIIIGDWAGRTVAEHQPVKLAAIEGLARDHEGRAVHVRRLVQQGHRRGRVRDRGPQSAVAARLPRSRTRRSQGIDTVPPDDRPPINLVRFAFQTMVGIGTLLALLGVAVRVHAVAQAATAALGLVLPGARAGRPARSRGADRGLDHDRGRAPAVDRLRGHAGQGRRDEQRRPGARLRRAGRRLPAAGRRRRMAAAAARGAVPRGGGGAALMAEICLGLIFVGLTMYAVLGGADFGAGLWDLTAGGARRGGRVRGLIQRSMSPVWEANHVWLIFVLVIAWTAFPLVFGAVFTTFLVPLFLVALGIIMRGTAFALRGQAATIAEARVLGAVFALLLGRAAVLPRDRARRDRGRRGRRRRTPRRP